MPGEMPLELLEWYRLILAWDSIALTDDGRVTHIYVGKLTINGSDNGLAPSRRQAIIWTNDGILLMGSLLTAVEVKAWMNKYITPLGEDVTRV